MENWKPNFWILWPLFSEVWWIVSRFRYGYSILNDLPYIKFKTIKAAAQQMLTLAGDRFTEEEFNLGQFFFKIIIIQF